VSNLILDPATLKPATKREIVIHDSRLALFASQAGTAFGHLELGVVCVHCQQPPQMANHQTDDNWKMECDCTVRVLKNPMRSRRDKILN
jgi:hypothetical protein